MAKKLYIGNLNFDTTDAELEQAFAEFGEVVSAVVVKDRVSGRSRGFGFVEYADEASAKKAQDAMNGKDIGGRPLRVDEAREQRRERRDRDDFGGGGGGYGRNRY
jgi:cold-inducible RNA-binding protein